MVLFYIIFSWTLFGTLGLALYQLRPDKERLYQELKILEQSTRYRITFPLAMFLYLPFSIIQSLKKILYR
jgi:hypothetical protein